MTTEILGVDVYIGAIAFGIGMVIMVALIVGTYLDSRD
jgi:hypothetical protein